MHVVLVLCASLLQVSVVQYCFPCLSSEVSNAKLSQLSKKRGGIAPPGGKLFSNVIDSLNRYTAAYDDYYAVENIELAGICRLPGSSDHVRSPFSRYSHLKNARTPMRYLGFYDTEVF